MEAFRPWLRWPSRRRRRRRRRHRVHLSSRTPLIEDSIHIDLRLGGLHGIHLRLLRLLRLCLWPRRGLGLRRRGRIPCLSRPFRYRGLYSRGIRRRSAANGRLSTTPHSRIHILRLWQSWFRPRPGRQTVDRQRTLTPRRHFSRLIHEGDQLRRRLNRTRKPRSHPKNIIQSRRKRRHMRHPRGRARNPIRRRDPLENVPQPVDIPKSILRRRRVRQRTTRTT